MKFDVLYLLVLGFFIDGSDGDGGEGHHKHVKIIVPAVYHKHNHKHTVYEKVPVIQKHVVVHQHKHDHEHKHGHDHDHEHQHKHGHEHDHVKHETPHHHYGHHEDHDDHGYQWNHYKAEEHQNGKPKKYDSFAVEPIYFNDDDGYHTSKKSVKSEHYEVKRLNPNAIHHGDKYIVKGSYKVEETDPFDFTTTSYQSYDSPIGKEIAQSITNFGGKYDNLLPFKKEKDEDDNAYDEKPNRKEADANYENFIDYDDGKQPGYQGYQEYDDYGDNTKTLKQYKQYPARQQLVGDGKYNYGNEASIHYISKKYFDNFDGGK